MYARRNLKIGAASGRLDEEVSIGYTGRARKRPRRICRRIPALDDISSGHGRFQPRDLRLSFYFQPGARRQPVCVSKRFYMHDDSSCTAANSASGSAGATTQTDIQKFVKNVPNGIDPNKLTVAADWPIQTNSPTACSTTANAPGCTVQVSVSYVFNFTSPLVSSTSLTLSSKSQAVITH